GTEDASGAAWAIDGGATVEVDVVAPSGGWALEIDTAPQGHLSSPAVVYAGAGGRVTRYLVPQGGRVLSVGLHSGVTRVFYEATGGTPIYFSSMSTKRSASGRR